MGARFGIAVALAAGLPLAAGCVGSSPEEPVDASRPVVADAAGDGAVSSPDAGSEGAVSVPDAGPSGFAVRGIAAGVLVPVALELDLGNAVELLSVTRDGLFTFDNRLEDGAAYTVALADPTLPCTLRHQTGTIDGADTAIELTCMGASLASVVVSGIAPAVALVPGRTDYVIELPLSQASITLTATVAVPGDTLTLAGTPVPSGMPSAPMSLDLGDNRVDIVVENPQGWQRTYRLTLRRASQLAQYAYGKASNTGAEDFFGVSVALSGDTLAVGAHQEDGGATGVGGDPSDSEREDSGAVYVFRRTGAVWQQEAYIKASNTDHEDYFGWAVALSGDTLVVGAYLEDSASQGLGGDQDSFDAENSGAVYVFRRSGTEWQQEAYVKASNTGAHDHFGASVALSGDTFAVGAWGEASAAAGVGGDQTDDSAQNSGAVYVFRRTGTGWQQEAYVKASNPDASDHFGIGIALSGDTLAVGAYREASSATGVGGNQADDSAGLSGAVYVFRRTGTEWQQEAYIKASNAGAGDLFGASVALAGDTLAVGAPGEDSGARGVGGNQADDDWVDSGAVYVFRRSGAAWQQEGYIKASNTGSGDEFGESVALSGDTLAVGTGHEDSGARGVDGDQNDWSAGGSGAVYVLRRSGAAWQQSAYVKASNTGSGDHFGGSVAVSDDTLAVAAYGERSAATGVNGDQGNASAQYSGAVYIFH